MSAVVGVGAAMGGGESGLARRVIPCLDVADGQVVKGVRFADFVAHGDPAELAARYAAEGADEIVFLDVAASHERRGPALAWVERTAERVFVPLTVGGGVAALDDALALLAAGADKVGVNSAAVERPALLARLAERFGSQCVVLSVDARRRNAVEGGWEVVTHGGRRPRGLDAVAWAAEMARRGAGEILLTSMDRDGTKHGYDLPLTQAVADAIPIQVIASGGAGALAHFAEVLTVGHADAALAASLFHYRELSIGEVKAYLARQGVGVRWTP